MFKRVKKLLNIIKYYFEDEDNLLLHLMEMKAYEILDACYDLDVGMTEEIEDFIFHIRTYYDIPETIASTKYPDLVDVDIPTMMKKYKKCELDMSDVLKFADYLEEVESQRAVERDIIFEEAKMLSFGFRL